MDCQNLIGNPYFNSLFPSNFPNGGWEATLGSGVPFFHFNRCGGGQNVIKCPGAFSAPLPKFGNGYFSNVFLENQVNSQRNFTSSFLSQPLVANEEYTVEFWYIAYARNNYHGDRLGVYIGNDTVFHYNYINYPPQVETHQPITDTVNWKLLKGSFIAQGGEQKITIGNFYSAAQTTLIPNPPYLNAGHQVNASAWPMVFIDGVFVYKSTDTVYTVTLPPDTMLCPNETLNLVAQIDSGFKLQDTVTTYLWNNGSTDSTLLVTAPGTYWVQTTINHRFVQTDTIVVSYFKDDYTLDLPDSVAICENDLANISAATLPQTQYYWDNGHTGQTLYDVGTGTYALEAVTPCYTLLDTVKVYQQFCDTYIYIPNSFTPDGDGTNDFFAFTSVPEPVTLLIYDRWGGLVFKDTAYQNTWDGTSGGKDLPAGAYNYVIEYLYFSPNATSATEGSSKSLTGTVRILR